MTATDANTIAAPAPFTVLNVVLDSGERLPCLVESATWLPVRVATRWAVRYRRYRVQWRFSQAVAYNRAAVTESLTRRNRVPTWGIRTVSNLCETRYAGWENDMMSPHHRLIALSFAMYLFSTAASSQDAPREAMPWETCTWVEGKGGRLQGR